HRVVRPVAAREQERAQADAGDQRDLERRHERRDAPADGDLRAVDQRDDDPGAGGDDGDEALRREPSPAGDVEEDREPGGETGQPAGGGDEEPRPSVEEAPDAPVGLANEHVLAAGLGHHRRQLGVGQRARQAEQPADDPHQDHADRRADVAAHAGRLEEDAGPDDVADDHRGRRQQAEAADQRAGGHRRAVSLTSAIPTSMNCPPRTWWACTAMVFFPARSAARTSPASGTYWNPPFAPGSFAASTQVNENAW